MKKNNLPIGVFDSGVGGLTVVKELAKTLPNENIIYFGDTARVPYGSKSKNTVVRFSMQICKFLLEKKVKLILVACNTASALALETLRKSVKIPVIGVIESGAAAAASRDSVEKIGVIGTEATIKSNSYLNAVKKLSPNKTVVQKACPLLVPLAEEGWIKGRIAEEITEKYLLPLKKSGCKSIILGCTHYPLLKKTISKVLGKEIILIDSAEEVSKEIRRILSNQKILNTGPHRGRIKFYVSDAPEKFLKLGKIFVGKLIGPVKFVNIEAYHV